MLKKVNYVFNSTENPIKVWAYANKIMKSIFNQKFRKGSFHILEPLFWPHLWGSLIIPSYLILLSDNGNISQRSKCYHVHFLSPSVAFS